MKNLRKRIFSWCAVIVLLITACFLPLTTQTALAVTAGDAVVYMDNAIKVQEVTHVFKKCVNMATTESSVSALLHFGDVFTNQNGGTLFGNNKTNYSAGAWLEYKVQGKVDDGEIWCQNEDANILHVFANTLGLGSWQKVVCNGTQPGIMTLQVLRSNGNVNYWENTSAACDIGFGNGDYKFALRSKDDALGYVKKLYEDYKEAHPEVAKYLPAWDDIGSYTDQRTGYFLYLNDFKTACTDGTTYTGDLSLMNQSRYYSAIKEVDPNTGELKDVYYKKEVRKKNWSSSIVGSSGAHTCDDVMKKINNYASAVSQEAKAIVAEAVQAAEAAAKERAKKACKMKAHYANVTFNGEGEVVSTSDYGKEPTAVYYYLEAKKIVDDQDAVLADVTAQLRGEIEAANPGLTSDEIDELMNGQTDHINSLKDSLVTRAQEIVTKFEKVLYGAGAGTGNGNKETSYWYTNSSGNIVCTEFDTFDGTITNDSNYQDILDNLLDEATSERPIDIPGYEVTATEVEHCYTAAQTLGWIICPVLKVVSNITATVYEWIENDFLAIDAGLLGSETRSVWQQFRNYANIAFAIFFVIVILSQVTGIGISNYGIKKILPRLIMVVFLVNVSFLICQVAVDLSNLLGSGLETTLASIHFDRRGQTGWNARSVVLSVLATLFSGGIVTGGVILTGITWEYWLIPLLLAILGALIGIFFFFMILAIRKALVIVLIAISPVAMVCYALPNTKSLFDKWFKAFSALLLAYPICGLLMGGGQFASSLIITATPGDDMNFMMSLTAMLLSIVPFFFIPSIIRSSMNGLGQLGARISGFGDRLSRGIQGGIRRSQYAQDAQRSLGMHNDERTVDRINRREQRLARRGRTLSQGQANRRARAASRYRRNAGEDAKALAEDGRLPTRGSAEWDDLTAGARRQVDDQQVKDTLAGYMSENSDVDMSDIAEHAVIDPATGRNAIDPATGEEIRERSAVEREYEEMLDRLDRDPNDHDAEIRVRALQEYLATQSEDGQELIHRVMRRRMHSGQLQGASVAASHIANDGKFVQAIKAGDRELFNMVGDLRRRDYSHIAQRDASGNFVRNADGTYAAQTAADIDRHYASSGINSMTGQSLAGMNDAAAERLADNIANGNISDPTQLSRLMAAMNEAVSNPNISLKGGLRGSYQRALAAGYGVGASAAGGPSAGATALSGASLETMNQMTATIRNFNGGQAFDPATAPAAGTRERADYDRDYQTAQRMAENARATLQDSTITHSQESAQHLQEIIDSARVMNVMDSAGNAFGTIDPAAIRIRGVEAPRQRITPAPPEGFDVNGNYTPPVGTPTTPNRQQQIAFEEWAKIKAENDRYNTENGFPLA